VVDRGRQAGIQFQKVATSHRNVAGDLIDVAQHRQLATHRPITQWITHRPPNDLQIQVSTIFLGQEQHHLLIVYHIPAQ
jgi:hypothetical protein